MQSKRLSGIMTKIYDTGTKMLLKYEYVLFKNKKSPMKKKVYLKSIFDVAAFIFYYCL